MSNGQAGKGSTYRKVNGDKYRRNYDRVFGPARKAVKKKDGSKASRT